MHLGLWVEMEGAEDRKQKERITSSWRPRVRPTYPKKVEANGKGGFWLQGLCLGFWSRDTSTLQGTRDLLPSWGLQMGSKNCRFSQKCVWSRTQQVRWVPSSPSISLPKPLRTAQTQGTCPRIPTWTSIWTDLGVSASTLFPLPPHSSFPDSSRATRTESYFHCHSPSTQRRLCAP